MNTIKKAWYDYRTLGTNTRFFIRIILILFFCIYFTGIYAYNATHLSNHYNLLLLCDILLEWTKSIPGIGFLGILIIGIAENKTN